MDDTLKIPLDRIRQALGLDETGHHVFLCCDQTEPRCSAAEAGLESWSHLKRRIRELGLDRARPTVLRSKVDCLRVCQKGPIAVVYPDGVWYHSCTPDVIDRILTEHIQQGRIVEDHCFARPARRTGTPAPGTPADPR